MEGSIAPLHTPGVNHPARPLPDGLTTREAEVLALVATGMTNKEIAARLHISAATAQRHIANIYGKIGASNRSQATSYVMRHGLGYMAGTTRSA
jgi:DNA-binding NarL/FixJ family response regulator